MRIIKALVIRIARNYKQQAQQILPALTCQLSAEVVRDASAQKPARDTTLRHPTTLSSYYPATPANWTEHLVPKNPGTDPDKSLLCNMKLQSFGREVSPCSVSSLFALNAPV